VAQENLVGDRFRIEEEIGSGGMGTVYRARDLETGATVAVKVLRPIGRSSDIQRFSRESSLLANLANPGIVKYLAHGSTQDGRHYLVMEWINGETLAIRLQRRGLTVAESVDVARQAAEALEDVHRAGVIHRDLTPRNLMFESAEDVHVKLVDFGVARRQGGVRLTRTGIVVGSPGYMAPEQARGQKDLDERVDLFALGCILYECLTGRPAFIGDPVSLPMKVLFADPLSVREINELVSPALDFLVRRMLSKSRLHRPKGAGELAAELSALCEVESAPRKRAVGPEPQTETVILDPERKTTVLEEPAAGRPGFTFLLLIGPADGTPVEQGQTTASRRLEIEALLNGVGVPHDSQVEILDGGMIALKLAISASPQEAADRVVRATLPLRAHFPGMAMALVAESSASPDMESLIERATDSLNQEDMSSLFEDSVGDGSTEAVIRLDPAAQQLLQGRYPLVVKESGVYLSTRSLPG
jgi:serine/threonine protein kinase